MGCFFYEDHSCVNQRLGVSDDARDRMAECDLPANQLLLFWIHGSRIELQQVGANRSGATTECRFVASSHRRLSMH
jgi:hypothetical protein